MSTNNDTEDQVDKISRDENARIRTDLMRGIFGAMPTGRIERGGAVFAKNEILQKQREKDKEEQREAFKRAQEALERHLDELNKILAKIDERLNEIRKQKSALDQLEELYRRGKLDAQNAEHIRLAREAGLTREQIEKDGDIGKLIERLRKGLDVEETELEKQRKEVRKGIDKIKSIRERGLPTEEEASQLSQVVRDAKAATLWETRTWEDTKGPQTSGLTLSESANPLQNKLAKGDEVSAEVLDIQQSAIKADADMFFSDPVGSSASIAANLDGDGSYKKSIGKEGLSSKEAFTTASNNADKEPLPEQEANQEPKGNIKQPGTSAKV